MKRIAAICLIVTVLLLHPAAAALGQEPDIAIPAGALVQAVESGNEAAETVSGEPEGAQSGSGEETRSPEGERAQVQRVNLGGAAAGTQSGSPEGEAAQAQSTNPGGEAAQVQSTNPGGEAAQAQSTNLEGEAAQTQSGGGQPGEAAGGESGGAAGKGESSSGAQAADADPAVQIGAPSALLMEASTGQVIYEKGADDRRSPASVTKVMTLILIFDALESGKINLTDQVVTSARAKSMGGSQVFLEEGEVQTVETLIKCIVIASGNDASVAMAEYIAGTEEEFVRMMNERAAGLGMANTHFVDCCGLTESPEHLTTARDIALMSRELINRYPQIHNYSTIWMENITHVTKQGTKEFGLSNTNKLLKMANNFTVTGLKTGSTSIAKYCLSATAEKDGVRLIAAIMAAPDYKTRFGDAQTLLNYGYANCRLYEDRERMPLSVMPVTGGVEDEVALRYEGVFSYLSLKGEDFAAIQRELVLPESIEAPVEPGQKAGVLKYTLNGTVLGQVDVVTDGAVRKAGYVDYLKKLIGAWQL